MSYLNKTLRERAEALVYTSVGDAGSSLSHFRADDMPVLRLAVKIIENGSGGHQATKRKLLLGKIRNLTEGRKDRKERRGRR